MMDRLDVDRHDMMHGSFVMNRFVVNSFMVNRSVMNRLMMDNWLMMNDWLMMDDWRMVSHGQVVGYSLVMPIIELHVVVTANIVMNCHSGNDLNVTMSSIVVAVLIMVDGLNVSNSLMDDWGFMQGADGMVVMDLGLMNRLRMVSVASMAICYIVIVVFLIT